MSPVLRGGGVLGTIKHTHAICLAQIGVGGLRRLGSAVQRPESELGKPCARIKAGPTGACVGNMVTHLGMHCFASFVAAQRLRLESTSSLLKAHGNRSFDGARVFGGFGVGSNSYQCLKALSASVVYHIANLYFGTFHILDLFCSRMFGASVLIWTLSIKNKLLRSKKVSLCESENFDPE